MVCPAGRARPVLAVLAVRAVQAEENAVRKCAYLKHVFAKSAWAFILSRRYDRLDIRCLRLYRNTAAETVRRVKRVLKAALVIFKAEKHINEYRLMPRSLKALQTLVPDTSETCRSVLMPPPRTTIFIAVTPSQK